MDTLADNEIKSIWNRVKRYINPENLKARSREELEREISQQMRVSGDAKKQGSMDSLLRNGFAERVSKISEIKDQYVVPVTEEGKILKAKTVVVERKGSPNMKKVRFNRARTTIKTRKGFRSYKPQNVRVTSSAYRGRAAYYVSNVRTGKRIAWGFIE